MLAEAEEKSTQVSEVSLLQEARYWGIVWVHINVPQPARDPVQKPLKGPERHPYEVEQSERCGHGRLLSVSPAGISLNAPTKSMRLRILKPDGDAVRSCVMGIG